jgi:proline dehydrogenase
LTSSLRSRVRIAIAVRRPDVVRCGRAPALQRTPRHVRRLRFCSLGVARARRARAVAERIAAACRGEEAPTVAALIGEARLSAAELAAAQALASKLAEAVRVERSNAGGVDALMLEFSLESREGIALMCLAEALLRIPDAATRDRLIRDKISKGDWSTHVGASPSLFVNAAAWGLLVTGKIVDSRSEGTLEMALASLLRKGRRAADPQRRGPRHAPSGTAIRHRPDDRRGARQRARARSARLHVFVRHAGRGGDDRSRRRALRCRLRERDPRHRPRVGRRGPIAGPGISVKLSRCIPVTCARNAIACRAELVPRVTRLAALARGYGIGFNIDAEEADRLDLSLDILATLAGDPRSRSGKGLGFVVQAYQKRARHVIDWIVALARSHRRRLMVRLVKGAYWDSEIKRAQVDGHADYPVFTRKVHTDVAYLACAKAMLAAPEAIYPQFASHNAFTVAAIHVLAGERAYEFQCLHGMGESLYDQGRRQGQARSGLPHLRAGRIARDAPCVSRAAAARKRREQLVRQPHRRSGGQHRVARRSIPWRWPRKAAACRTPTSRCLRRSCRDAAIRRAPISPTTQPSPRSRQGLSGASGRAPRRRSWCHPPLIRLLRPSPSAIPRIATTSSAR